MNGGIFLLLWRFCVRGACELELSRSRKYSDIAHSDQYTMQHPKKLLGATKSHFLILGINKKLIIQKTFKYV